MFFHDVLPFGVFMFLYGPFSQRPDNGYPRGVLPKIVACRRGDGVGLAICYLPPLL